VADDKRIAVVAILVTGVVGVAAPVITWRAGVSGQRAASRDARVRDDLAELRARLDHALANFIDVRNGVELELQSFSIPYLNRLTDAEARSQEGIYVRRHNAAVKAWRTAAADGVRLRIRLGNDRTYRAYATALSAYRGASLYMVTHTSTGTGSGRTGELDRVNRRIDRANAAFRNFEAAAHRLVGSRLS
jgi:hypothetical protein